MLKRWLKRIGAGGGILIAASLLFLAGYYTCRTVVSRERFAGAWSAASDKAADDTDLLSGRWEGTWTSEGAGDGGGLRCVIRANGNGAFEARFLSGHYGVFDSEDIVMFRPRSDGDAWVFEGETDLGLEGTYGYSGITDGEELDVEWTSLADHGTLTVTRKGVASDALLTQCFPDRRTGEETR